ncbi:MAG TPA: HEAT repeat domain-containing protein [Bryobacteraceae bacterium]|nr:HEAT repeat domain-containing protein [Bryobacteraceae bacterium]
MSGRGAWVLMLAAVGSAQAAGTAAYAGAAACAKCHVEAHSVWSQSRHSKMVQPATVKAVQGNFAAGRVVLRGLPYLLRQANGAFYITESYLTGKPQQHRVDFTLGNRRIQHYLTRLPDGKVIVLPPSWDILRKQWFHNLDIDDPEEAPGIQVQVWNKNCFSCHVSQQQKNFDPATDLYKTSWLDFGINCERCHGPGSQHIARYSAAAAAHTKTGVGPADDIVMQTRLDASRNTMVCAQCHSFRDIYALGYTAGADYYDYFFPVLEYGLPDDGDPAYWADGRTRRFSNDAFGLWQSECFLKGGATCLTCHVVAHNTNIDRNPQLRPEANALCTQCHTAIGKDIAAHTHHATQSAGSSCVECHMPRTVYSIKAQIRDHSMSIPVPENTIHHDIPNACNLCHKDRNAQWALATMDQWWGDRSRQKLIRRADTFAAARKGDAGSIPALVAILGDSSEGQLVRANAAGHLGRFEGQAVFDALVRATADPEPLVRAVAVLSLKAGQDRATAAAALVKALADRVATVRLAAMLALVNMGIRELPGEDGERLQSAMQMFQARAQFNADDAEQQVAAGRFYLLAADPARAIAALRDGLRLDPTAPAQYLLAGAYVEQSDYPKAREILLAIPPGDAQYDKAQRLLKALAAQTARH